MPDLLDRNALRWIPPLLIFYNFCANLANDIYLPSMPTLAHIFGTSSNVLQWTMTAWFAGIALPQLFFGPLTDSFGRRPILIGGGICFLFATLLCATATNITLLIVGRFLQGMGVCSLNVTSFGILVDLYDYKNRAHIINKITISGNVAPLVGPLIGGYVLTWLGWRANFYVIFLLGFLAMTGLWFKLPESNLQLNQEAIRANYIFKNYYQLLRSDNFLKNLLPYCLFLGGLIVYLTSAPFILINHFKIPPQDFGYLQLPIFLTFLLGSFYLGKTKDEKKIKKFLVRGIALIFFAGVLMTALNYFFPKHLFAFIVPTIIYALGFSFCASPLITEVMSCTTTTKGSAAAFLGFMMALSCLLASLLLGYVYDGTAHSVSVLMFLITLLGFSIYFLQPPNAITMEQTEDS